MRFPRTTYGLLHLCRKVKQTICSEACYALAANNKRYCQMQYAHQGDGRAGIVSTRVM